MKVITNSTGTKAVNISTSAIGTVRAIHVQIYNGEQDVIQAKDFASIKKAENWAAKVLN